MDRSIVSEKVNKIINGKNIPEKFVPFIHVFFQKYVYAYNLTEEQLDEVLARYVENMGISAYINMETGNIIYNERTKSLLIDSCLKDNMTEKTAELFLKNSISQQAKAVLPKDVLEEFYEHVAFIEYNELDNLYENVDNKLTILLNMVRNAVGTDDKRIYNAIHNQEDYLKFEKNGYKREANTKTYIRSILGCFDDLKENNDVITKELFTKIYGFCVIHFMERMDLRARCR